MKKLSKLLTVTMTAGMLLAACGDANNNETEDPAVDDGLEADPTETDGDPASDDGLESETDMDVDEGVESGLDEDVDPSETDGHPATDDGLESETDIDVDEPIDEADDDTDSDE